MCFGPAAPDAGVELLLDLLDGWHPCLRKQKDAGLARGGLMIKCGGVEGGGLAIQLA